MTRSVLWESYKRCLYLVLKLFFWVLLGVPRCLAAQGLAGGTMAGVGLVRLGSLHLSSTTTSITVLHPRSQEVHLYGPHHPDPFSGF